MRSNILYTFFKSIFFVLISLVVKISLNAQVTPIPVNTWHVSPVGNDYNTGKDKKNAFRNIQTAINRSKSGDVVLVYAGETPFLEDYQENVVISKSILTIKGIPSVEGRKPVVKGIGQTGYVFHLNADQIILSGFEIFNNIGNETTGIWIERANRCLVYNNTIGNVHRSGSTRRNFYGLKIDYGTENQIIQNEFNANVFGVFLKKSERNIIFLNEFIKSDSSHIRLIDTKNNHFYSPIQISYSVSTENKIFKGYVGNYYDNLAIKDKNNDGINENKYPSNNSPIDFYPTVYSKNKLTAKLYWLIDGTALGLPNKGNTLTNEITIQAPKAINITPAGKSFWSSSKAFSTSTTFNDVIDPSPIQSGSRTSWTGQLSLQKVLSPKDSLKIEIGYSKSNLITGLTFSPVGPSIILRGNGVDFRLVFKMNPKTFTIPRNCRLALRVTNLSSFPVGIMEGGMESFCSEPGITPPTILPTVVYVSYNGTDDDERSGSIDQPWRSIQFALSRVRENGKIYLIGDGSDQTVDFSEHVIIRKPIGIENQYPANPVPTIQANTPGKPVFQIESAGVTIKGLTIQSGGVKGASAVELRQKAKNCRLEKLKIEAIDTPAGFTGVYLNQADSNLIHGCYFNYNTAAIKVKNAKGNHIFLNSFSENTINIEKDELSNNQFESPFPYSYQYKITNKIYQSVLGNYYSDLIIVDKNKDGIVDPPFQNKSDAVYTNALAEPVNNYNLEYWSLNTDVDHGDSKIMAFRKDEIPVKSFTLKPNNNISWIADKISTTCFGVNTPGKNKWYGQVRLMSKNENIGISIGHIDVSGKDFVAIPGTSNATYNQIDRILQFEVSTDLMDIPEGRILALQFMNKSNQNLVIQPDKYNRIFACFTPSPLEELIKEPQKGVATSISEANQFIYTGEKALQKNITGKIETNHLSVIKGKVQSNEGLPLKNVKVTILGHPELGETYSRVDGLYDIVTNGGTWVNVKFEKAGYLPVQRRVQSNWKTSSITEDVIMSKPRPPLKRLTLNANRNEWQTFEGEKTMDMNGERRAILVVPNSVKNISLKKEGVLLKRLNSFTPTITEYTIGTEGPSRMPAVLPPNIGYTYCVEVGSLEADKDEASSVEFSDTAYIYVDNYLEMPIGMNVPVGYFDGELGVWVPSENGRVLKVMSIQNGLAQLNGGDDLGIQDLERKTIAEEYGVGKSFWRVPITHLTPYDCNWPIGCSDVNGDGNPDCEEPEVEDPYTDESTDKENTCKSPGNSTIDIQNQHLVESIPLIGTPFSLNYKSNRTKGYRVANKLTIPLSGANLPQNVTGILLDIKGPKDFLRMTFPSSPNLPPHTYLWDGTNDLNQELNGAQPVKVSIGYKYPLEYVDIGTTPNGFGMRGGEVLVEGGSATEIVKWKHWEGNIGAWKANNIEVAGWTVDIQHSYNPDAHILYYGNGEQKDVCAKKNKAVQTIAGGKKGWGEFEDGMNAKDAIIENPRRMAFADDGALYFTTDHYIYRITTNGKIYKVAGNIYGVDSIYYSGPAINAKLYSPTGIDMDAFGNIYFTENAGAHCIRKIDTNGNISFVAGSYGPGFQNGYGRNAAFRGLEGITIGADGNLYVADRLNYAIRRITPDYYVDKLFKKEDLSQPKDVAMDAEGNLYVTTTNDDSRVWKLTTNGVWIKLTNGGNPSDDIPASSAAVLHPSGIAVDDNGNVFISDYGNGLLRYIDSRDTIRRLAGIRGSVLSCTSLMDNVSPINTGVCTPKDIAISPDGDIYFVQDQSIYNSGSIRKISLPVSAYLEGDYTIPSEDGSQIFLFDNSGRHLKTLNATNGNTLYAFSYDTIGRLAKIEDGFENSTSFAYDLSSNTIDITAPYGQKTRLVADAQNHLHQIVNPLAQIHVFSYDNDGLMLSRTDPKGKKYTYEFDELGRLIGTKDLEGGFKTFKRVKLGNVGFNVSVSTAEGRNSRYEVFRDTSIRAVIHKNSFSCCGSNTKYEFDDGRDSTQMNDGTNIVTQRAAHPIWGMRAPYLSKMVVRTPGGLVQASVRKMSVEPGFTNPFDIPFIYDTLTINGAIAYHSVFDTKAGKLIATSAEGRKSISVFNELGMLILDSLPGMYAVRYGYDARGRLTNISQGQPNNPSNQRSYRIAYNAAGLVDSLFDPLGQFTHFKYDAAGRMIQKVYNDGRVMETSYDENDNIGSIKVPAEGNAPEHEFSYNAVNLTTSYEPPKLSDVPNPNTYIGYNRDRDLIKLTRPDSSAIEPVYNMERDRLEKIQLPNGQTISFSYFEGAGSSGGGQLKSIANKEVTLSYTYDGALPKSETYHMMGKQFSVAQTYDNNFRLDSLKVSSTNVQHNTKYLYDKDGAIARVITSVPGKSTPVQMAIRRDPITGFIKQDSIGLIRTDYAYTPWGELERQSAYIGNNLAFERAYTYDKAGRIIKVVENREQQSKTYEYGYDASGRLEKVLTNGLLTRSYQYTKNGNRQSATDHSKSQAVAGTYDAQDRLVQYGSTQVAYTPNGELRKETSGATITEYVYNTLGELIESKTTGSPTTTLIYDGLGRLVVEKTGNQQRGLLYMSQLQPVAQIDNAGQIATLFVYIYGSNSPDIILNQGNAYRIIKDHLGSPCMLVEVQSGQIVQRMAFDEYGITNSSALPYQPFGFAGGLSFNTGRLVKFGVRFYHPAFGKWNSKEPLMFLDGENLYEYVAGDVVNLLDQFGTQKSNSNCGFYENEILRLKGEIDRINQRVSLLDKLIIDENEVINDMCSGGSEEPIAAATKCMGWIWWGYKEEEYKNEKQNLGFIKNLLSELLSIWVKSNSECLIDSLKKP